MIRDKFVHLDLTNKFELHGHFDKTNRYAFKTVILETGEITLLLETAKIDIFTKKSNLKKFTVNKPLE